MVGPGAPDSVRLEETEAWEARARELAVGGGTKPQAAQHECHPGGKGGQEATSDRRHWGTPRPSPRHPAPTPRLPDTAWRAELQV